MGGHAHDIQKEVRTYLIVFFALGLLTVVTVAISYLHLPFGAALAAALFVAAIKAGLVAGFFMHLISERKLIYTLLSFTILFFVCLMITPMFTHEDGLVGSEDVSYEYLKTLPDPHHHAAGQTTGEHSSAPAGEHGNEH